MTEQRLKPAKREPADVSLRFVWIGAGSVVAAISLLAALVLWMFPHSRADQRLRLPLPDYPRPVLQQNPVGDLAAYMKEQQARLNSFGWIDQAAGVAHIPIEQAMREIAEEKIADWPGQPSKTAGPSGKPLAQESDHAELGKTPSPPAPAVGADHKPRRGRAIGAVEAETGRPHAPRRGASRRSGPDRHARRPH